LGKSTKKLTYEYIKEYIINLGYELISEKYVNANSKLILKDKEGYYYFIIWFDIFIGSIPNKFHKSNPYTIKNIKLWLKLNNKEFELISDEYEKASIKLKWKCLKEECGEEFKSSWNDIIGNKGCPFCAGKQVGLSNCLATKNTVLAKEWHPTKNGDLTPWDVTCGCNKYVWWQCSKNPKHMWYVKINKRNSGDGCPYCSGHKPSEDYNLLKNNPELCEEWDYEKNKKRPEEYCPNANQYAYWKCKECGHKWKAKINNRNNGRCCPECSKSKGEKEISKIFINNNWIKISQEDFDKLINEDKYNNNYFISQMKYNGLIGVGGGLLSYDFHIPKLNLLIEYDGEYHYKPIKNYKNEPIKYAKERYKKQCIHDILKNKYAMNNDIDLLRIPYWEFNNIEEILNNYVFKIINI